MGADTPGCADYEDAEGVGEMDCAEVCGAAGGRVRVEGWSEVADPLGVGFCWRRGYHHGRE